MDDNVKSLAQLLAEPPRRGDWGGWQLDSETCSLHLPRDPNRPEDGDHYWCDLRRCTSEQGVLFWLYQMEGKRWVTDRMLAGLVRALGDLFAPQHAYSLTLEQVGGRVADVATWLPPREAELTPKQNQLAAGTASSRSSPRELREDNSVTTSCSTDGQSPAVAARLDGIHLVVDCPFCHRQHHHGAGDPEQPPYPAYGPRVAHCGDGQGRSYILTPEGG